MIPAQTAPDKKDSLPNGNESFLFLIHNQKRLAVNVLVIQPGS